MRHLLITRLWFDSEKLLDKYLDVAVNTFIPSLKAQTCKDFEFGILLRKEHIEHVRERIGIKFIPYTGGIEQFREVAHKEGLTVQTRHDIDDWMASTYIEEIQKCYKENKDKYASFVIFAQPVKMEYPSGKVMPVPAYNEKRISMFATLCQRDPVHPIYKGSHGALYQYGEKIFKLPDGLVKWVQHPDSVTNARLKRKGVKKVGNMELYDEDHNWISERNTDPVINVLTRTFKRPESFKKCRESVVNQTYCQGSEKFNDRTMKINHIVGSEEECDYYPAVKLSKKEGKFLPWNLHLNDLGKLVKTGYVMYLDDDDMFMSPTSVREIVDEIVDEDTLLIWKVRISTWTAPNDKHFGKVIKKGQVSGIGILFHSKHLPVPWKAMPAGDFHVIEYLSKKLKVKWVNKVLTGTQGGKNHHGAAFETKPEIKTNILVNNENPGKTLVSVGTPTWNNKDIYWLSIESLCRQQTDYPWELIVHECPSGNMLGEDYFKPYRKRLEEAGCQRLVYLNPGKRLDLSTKWIEIAKAAQGEILILHDSDDYTHPLRIQRTMELIGDKPWYDSRYAWHYSITADKLILFDYVQMHRKWKTGFNIALKTDILRKVKDPHKNAGMHKWMSTYVTEKYCDHTNYPCVATTGANTVSLSRVNHFRSPKPPFLRTNETIETIGLPQDIVQRLRGNKTMSALDILRAEDKVEVEFLRNYCRLYKKGERKRIPVRAADQMVRKNRAKYVNETETEQIHKEI